VGDGVRRQAGAPDLGREEGREVVRTGDWYDRYQQPPVFLDQRDVQPLITDLRNTVTQLTGDLARVNGVNRSLQQQATDMRAQVTDMRARAENRKRAHPVIAAPPPPETRIGDLERGKIIDVLGRHYSEGRLTLQEFEERSGTAAEATVQSALDPLVNDLPALRETVPAMQAELRNAGTRPYWDNGYFQSKPQFIFWAVMIIITITVTLTGLIIQ
jgi:TolA-binding protein